jgi:hypothetical protein
MRLVDRHELVRRARNLVFHVDCFACAVCRQRLHTGDQLYIVDGCRFICRHDYLAQQHAQLMGNQQPAPPTHNNNAVNPNGNSRDSRIQLPPFRKFNTSLSFTIYLTRHV